jgi:hypothetical protein
MIRDEFYLNISLYLLHSYDIKIMNSKWYNTRCNINLFYPLMLHIFGIVQKAI